MRPKEWYKELKDLSDKRFHMVTGRMSMTELRDFRDNYKRCELLFNRLMLIVLMLMMAFLAVDLLLTEYGIWEKDEFIVGYLLGLSISAVLVMGSGSYVRKIEKEMERRYFEEEK